ncbi:hypothetical protein JB92DRAFT_3093926 [Gautieria morchelliformis]|nr:hypothetical protein JB92DRAFT_3093926 [Gautieria morchelliformis]
MRFGHLIGLVGLWSLRKVVGQASTKAICTVDQWTTNEKGQNPCFVASALQAPCHSGQWNIPALTPGSVYTGPLQGQSNDCACSTVTYALISACSSCQNGSVSTWLQWSTNCASPDVSISTYPRDIPSLVTVPAWAYLNVTNGWDAGAAQRFQSAGIPDSSPSLPAATSTPPVTAPSQLATNKTSRTAAIAGGVVGGFLVLAAVLVIALAVYRRNNPFAKDEPPITKSQGEIIDVAGPISLAPNTPTPGYSHLLPMPFTPHQHDPMLLNPADPSTFPATPIPLTSRSASMYNVNEMTPEGSTPRMHSYAQPFSPYTHVALSSTSVVGYPHPAGYSGIPEV